MSTSPSKMKTIKVSEATTYQLEWLVAIALGWTDVQISAYEMPGEPDETFFRPSKVVDGVEVCGSGLPWKPTSNREQGWRIIEKIGGFELKIWLESSPSSKCEAHIHNYEGNWIAFGSTPLIAALRCFVASQLGENVEVPEVLG